MNNSSTDFIFFLPTYKLSSLTITQLLSFFKKKTPHNLCKASLSMYVCFGKKSLKLIITFLE
nr:MAG TPA: hypothetical protein [Caudoviricetes sp.]